MSQDGMRGIRGPGSEGGGDPGRLRTRAQFGQAITALRESRGLTVRDVAKLTGLPISTLGGYFAGRHLPPLKPVGQLPLLLRALGVEDDAAVQEWAEALRRLRRAQNARAADDASPYRGLACFEPEDAEWFFGREQLTAVLVERVAAGGLLAVVGPSGSGKSSLLRSGLVSALAAQSEDEANADRDTERAPVVLLTPGQRPVKTLEAALSAAGLEPRSATGSLAHDFVAGLLGPVTVVVDQFEEVFTQCDDEAERQLAIDVFCSAGSTSVSAESKQTSCVVLGLRADFYGRALRYPKLARVLQHDQVVVGPMPEAELRRAIVEPARRAGVEMESGLTERLLRDLGRETNTDAESFHHAGALPLLSHALLATWERANQQTMTLADYEAVGGIGGGVARTAEQVFAGLDDEGRRFARQLFVRLVLVADDTGDTRRRLPLREILDENLTGEQSERRERVVARFVEARLLTAREDSVEITHEALLTAWPQLREWLAGDREWLQRHRALSRAALQWRDSAYDPDQLYRGVGLQVVRELTEAGVHGDELNGLEHRFLEESKQHARDEALSERRRIRRRHRVIALVAVLVVCVVGGGCYAYSLRSADQREQVQALSRLVADEADRLRDNDVSLSMQLALAAYQISPTPEAVSGLLDSTGSTPDTRILVDSPPSAQPDAESIATSGNLMAVGTGSGSVELWSLADSRVETLGRPLRAGGGSVAAVALGDDGHLLVAGTARGVIDLWKISVLSKPRALAALTLPSGGIMSVALTDDGRLLAAGSSGSGTNGGRVGLWLLSNPAHPVPEAPAFSSPDSVNSVAFNPSGTLLVAGGTDTDVRLWRLDACGRPTPDATVAAGSVVFSVAVSPDGRTLAAGTGAGHDVVLWTLPGSGPPTPDGTLVGPASWVAAVAFGPNGATLAAASTDGRLWLFNLTTRQPIRELPHPNTVTGVAFGPGGTVVTVSVDDGTIRWWRLPGPVIVGARDSIFAVDFDATGKLLGVGPGSRDDTLTLWNTQDPENPAEAGTPLPGDPGEGAYSGSGALSPNGDSFASGDLNGTVQVWDVRDPSDPVRPEPPLPAAKALIESVGFSPNGRLLESSSDDGTVHVYTVTGPGRVDSRAVITTPGRSKIYDSAFSPNGDYVAAASGSDNTYVYALNGTVPRLVATVPGTQTAYSVVFLTNDIIAVGDSDGTTRIWQVAPGSSPVLLSGPLGGPIGYIYGLAYAHGILAVGGSQDGTIWLWSVADPAHPAQLATITGPAGGVFSVALRSDGHVLAAGAVDDTVQLWSTDPAQAASWICSVAGSALTKSEWQQYVPGRAYDPPCSSSSGPPTQGSSS